MPCLSKGSCISSHSHSKGLQPQSPSALPITGHTPDVCVAGTAGFSGLQWEQLLKWVLNIS